MSSSPGQQESHKASELPLSWLAEGWVQYNSRAAAAVVGLSSVSQQCVPAV